MGADIIGFINCPLQASLGLDGFLHKLKLRAYRGMIEEMVPQHQRAEVRVEVQSSNKQPQELNYAGILKQLGDFERGIPECATCPISGGGQAVGCYRFVKYPVDSMFEKLAFEFFISEVHIKDSICDQIYQDVASNVPLDSAWHTQRGFPESGGVAMLPKPLVHEWQDGNVRRRVDSAQVLGSLFISLDRPAMVVGYVRFWHNFIDYARPRVTNSPTLNEFLDIFPMYLRMLPIALENRGIIYIDG